MNSPRDNIDYSTDSEENEEVAAIMSKTIETELEGLSDKKRDEVKHQVLVVSGEASESEDEITMTSTEDTFAFENDSPSIESLTCASLLPDDTKFSSSETMKISARTPVKYTTLLHKKLKERNIILQRNLTDLMCRPFRTATREISNVTQQLMKTQLSIQDLAPVLRQLTNELFHLEDKIDSLLDHSHLIPDINIVIENEQINNN